MPRSGDPGLVAFVIATGCIGAAPASAQGPSEVRLEQNVMIPLRDGVRLATDLYFPAGSSGPWPVILFRTPYGKNAGRPVDESRVLGGPEKAQRLAAAGYVVAVQDVRGKHDSEGRFRVQADDANDS